MNNIKKYIKPLGLFLGFTMVYIILFTILHYVGWIKLSSISTVNFVLMGILAFLGGFSMGKKTSKRGYLEGLKFGGGTILILFVINALFYRHFDLYVVLYFFVILASSVIGSMIGINLRH